MTLYKVIDTIKMLSLKHPNINSAYEGNIYDIMNGNPQQKYASVVLTQQSHTQDVMYDHYGFNLFYVDRLVDDLEDNRVQIQSTGKSMLSNIIRAFCDEFDGECENITFQPFTERFADECAGVYCTITINMIKDSYCTEKYWDGNWSAPAIKIVNQDKKVEFTENGVYVIDYDSTLYTGLGKVEVEVNVETDGSYEEGYNDGFDKGVDKGIDEQKSKLETITINENGTYTKEDGYDEIIVNVIDTNGSYQEGYLDGETDGYNDGLADGIADGIEQQKSKLESITITENGTYTKEDGYNSIIVDVEGSGGGVAKVDVASLGGLKFGYSTFSEVPEIFDFSNVTDMSGMFKICENLTTIQQLDMSNAMYMSGMFYGCSNLTSIPLINTSKVIDMNGMFMDCYNLTSIPEINTSNVRIMSSIFTNCIQLETIPLLDTSNVEDMNCMFQGCYSFKTIPQLNTSNVTGMTYMFQSCGELETIPQLDTSNVEYMEWMFSDCSNLTSIPSLNTSKVINMEGMFNNCLSLPFVYGLDTSKVTNMSGMFFGCESLIEVGALDASNAQNVYYMFTACQHLMHFGGLLNLKCNAYHAGFDYCPDLTYESCINILNGLYDFTENGEDNTDAVLGVHPNFLDIVGDKISIGTDKGWTILVP
jgi:surface protein